jgi:hypothetical protein
MDLDGIFSFVLFILHWRIAVCLVGSSCLAIILVNIFPWLTGLHGIVLAALGLFPGAIWEEQETTPQSAKAVTPSETTKAVAGASAIIIGSAWGIFSSTSFHSFCAGTVIFLFAAWGWSWYANDLKRWVTKDRVLLCVVLASFSYPIAALLAHNAL